MVDSRVNWLRAASLGTSIATTLAGTVLGGFFLGRYLDSRWGTGPWLQFSATMVGLILGGAYVVYTLMRLGTEKNEK